VETQIREALARGYGSPENEKKVIDPVLIEAMVKEVIAAFEEEVREANSNINYLLEVTLPQDVVVRVCPSGSAEIPIFSLVVSVSNLVKKFGESVDRITVLTAERDKLREALLSKGLDYNGNYINQREPKDITDETKQRAVERFSDALKEETDEM